MLSPSLGGLTFPNPARSVPADVSAETEFQLHPHYRTPSPLDTTLLKVQAGLDDFISEKYADQVSAILAEWTSSLLESPPDLKAIENALAPNVLTASLQPSESSLVRAGPTLEVRRNQFSSQASLDRDAFLRELRSAISVYTAILTAEFQVTRIDLDSASAPAPHLPKELRTLVRYELVGTGRNFHREQRVGYWNLAWEPTPSGHWLVRKWRGLEETASRSASPFYVDITARALSSNPSYASQLLHGTDYWRTILDGACGIDIYGHNGVSVGDIDNDGFDDFYVCQPSGLPNRLYRNRGDGAFDDITEAAGVGVLENSACALFIDVDNDGLQDLIVVCAGGPLLFLNQGAGKFRQKPDAFHFAAPPQGTFTGAAAADYDRDGWLDIYFCLYTYYQGTGQYKYPSPYVHAENGPPNFMMRNHRDGTFRDVTQESGLNQNNTRYSFCCGWSDYNHDGWPDLYVVNDFGRKNLYRNNGDGTFTDIAAQVGAEDVGAGMGVCWFDYDNDGAQDLYVANMWTAAGERITAQDSFKKNAPEDVRALYRKHAMGNSLLRNLGKTFQDATAASGTGIGRWSWSSDAWDFDHDGFPDLYIANGMISGPVREDLNSFFWRQVVARSPDAAKDSHDYEQGWTAINELIRADGSWSGYERNLLYANNRNGTFSDVSGAVGLDWLQDGRAFALADFDHDGRLEVFLKNRNGPQLRVLKNVAENLPPSISFRLRGSKSNRDAIGAVISLQTKSGLQTRTLQAGSGFLSQHSQEIFFGLGESREPVRATIRWPSGLVQQLHDLPINHRIWVTEGSDTSRIEPFHLQTARQTPIAATQFPDADALPVDSETWLLAPVAAPDFSLPDLAGRSWTLSALHEKPLLLHLWTSRSAFCLEELAALDRWQDKAAEQGLQLMTVNLDENAGLESLRALAREHGVSAPILVGSDDVAGIYNILYRYLFDRHRDLALPTSFLISEGGEIVKVYQGRLNREHVAADSRHIPRTAAERLAVALPFPGTTRTTEFERNYLSYGSVFFQRGYYEQAKLWFRIALREDPSSAEALYGLGSVYLNQHKNAEARDCFQRATKLRASYPDTVANAWNNLGLLTAREGRAEEALGLFEEALRLSPDDTIALDNLGNAHRQRKQWDEARKAFARALEVDSTDPEANYGLAMVYAQTNDTEHAYQYLQNALRYRPVYPEALNNLGILYLRTQRRDQAVATFEECIRVAPAFDQAYLNLAKVYAIEGDPVQARTILLELLKQHPDHPQAQKALADLPQ
ncbi:MAG TPA: FG-GAP-like repeat-containing protein [Terriglobales bacterium]|nr:FG-GAP-like repeat-containing protein [Terriglobales bacterium]